LTCDEHIFNKILIIHENANNQASMDTLWQQAWSARFNDL